MRIYLRDDYACVVSSYECRCFSLVLAFESTGKGISLDYSRVEEEVVRGVLPGVMENIAVAERNLRRVLVSRPENSGGS